MGAGFRAGVYRRFRVRLLDRPAAHARAGDVRVPGALVSADGDRSGGIPGSHAAAERQMGDGVPAGGGFSFACPSDRKLVMIPFMKIRMLAFIFVVATFLLPLVALAKEDEETQQLEARLEGYTLNVRMPHAS